MKYASVIFACGELYCSLNSGIMLRIVILPAAVYPTNIISRKPIGFHITSRRENITPSKARNITFAHRYRSIIFCCRNHLRNSPTAVGREIRGVLPCEVRLSYIRLRRVVLFFEQWYYASHSYIACGSLPDEYNITEADRLSYHFPKGKYHSEQSSEYHFCP